MNLSNYFVVAFKVVFFNSFFLCYWHKYPEEILNFDKNFEMSKVNKTIGLLKKPHNLLQKALINIFKPLSSRSKLC